MALYEDDRDVTYEIMEEIGIISTSDTGWTREINLVRWNGGVAKYDIRDWDPYHERMSKGITLTEDEMRRMLNLMRRRRSNARNRRTAVREESVVSAEETAVSTEAASDAEETVVIPETGEIPETGAAAQ